jgi:Fe-S-cluster containining protein
MSFSTDFARIKEVQRQSRQGESGQWRKEYDRQYREVLERTYEEIRTEVLRYTASTGEVIACEKGCTHCCEHFVSIPVSHAVVIADYLYASENAMSAFLRGYGKWLRSITDNPQAAAVFAELGKDTAAAAVVKTSPQELLSAYHTFAIPCPFLDGKRCAIYTIRPLCCAAYFAISPPEYCRSDSEMPAALLQVTPSQVKLHKLAELADPRLSLHQESLPQLVYKMLTEGLPQVSLELEKLFNSQDTPPQT